jgi:hypothetical protein
MRSYREQDFDKMAERVVDRFMGGQKLADAATLEATDGQLNPDQIARMVQAANTQAFLRLMEQQKSQGTPDMTGEFDPIDPRQIIQQMVQSVDVPHMDQPHAEPDGDEGPLPNEMHGHAPPSFGEGEAQQAMGHDEPKDDDNDGPFPKGEKQKAKDDADKPKKKGPPKPPEKDTQKEAAFRSRRLEKFAGILEDQYKQAEWAFEDEFKVLDTALKQAWGGPAWDAFEKDACALHGDEYGASVLSIVRQSRRLSPISVEEVRAKHAALDDRHVVMPSPAITSFERLVKIAEEATKLARGAEHVRSMCS